MKKTILGLMAFSFLFFTVPMQSTANEAARTKAVEEISTEAIVEAKAEINKRFYSVNDRNIKFNVDGFAIESSTDNNYVKNKYHDDNRICISYRLDSNLNIFRKII